MRSVIISLAFAIAGAAAIAEPRIIDGDTFELDGRIIRLEGIDAPEEAQSCGNWACGEAAMEGLVEITKGRDIACTPHGQDAYGRTIATCFADGVDIGGTLVDKGLALAFRRYSDSYVDVEDKARDAARGVWRSAFQMPWEFRAARWTSAAEDAPEGCPIKGNISKNGRIYHVPWSRWYSRTKISTAKGERWFCSEDEAIAAGWRAPYAR